jgi:prevent-host-death family protein
MATGGVRELARNASRLVDEVASTGRPVVITKHGRPVAAVVGIDPAALEDFVLANAPEYVTARRQADSDLRSGRTRTAADVFADLDT